MQILHEVTNAILRLAAGASAVAGIIEASTDVPPEAHVISGIVLLVSVCAEAGIRAALKKPSVKA